MAGMMDVVRWCLGWKATGEAEIAPTINRRVTILGNQGRALSFKGNDERIITVTGNTDRRTNIKGR